MQSSIRSLTYLRKVKPGAAKLTLADLEREGFDQGGLFSFIEAELPGFLVDQFKLPGDQRQAVLERIQGLIVQCHVVVGVIEQAMNVQ